MSKNEPICYRYPSMFVCGCTIPCRIAMKEVKMNHVIDNVYVGPIQCAYDTEKLKQQNIRYIIDLSNSDYHTTPSEFTYTKISIEDSVNTNISSFFTQTNQIITKAQEEGKSVLVHCQAGVSRSVSVCMAYLIAYHNMTVEMALDTMIQLNPRSKPNKGFMQQLEYYRKDISK